MTIGNRISELRKAKGFTQEYIADQLGVTRQAVSKWEQDMTSPDTKNLIALSSLLDASIEYIATGKTASPSIVDKEQIHEIASEEVKKQEKKNKNKIQNELLKFMLIFLVLAIVVWVLGMVTGLFFDFRDINGLCIIFMPYGFSPTAKVLEVLYYLFLAAFFVLMYIGMKMEGRK